MAKTKVKKEKLKIEMPTVESGERKTIELEHIIANMAQSRGMGVLSQLADLGYGVFEKASVDSDKDALWDMLFHAKPEVQKKACTLLETKEPELVELAAKLNLTGQLQPIGVRQLEDGYDVIFGMRRALAAAYNHAKHDSAAVIEATVYDQEFDEAGLKLLALQENADRQEESPIDKAMTYKWLMDKSGMDAKSLSQFVGVSDQSIRNYRKLLDPKLEDKRMSIHSGAMSVDRALKLLVKRKGSGDGAGGDREGSNGEQRDRLPSAKQLIKLYDAPRKPKDMSEEEWELWIDPGVRKLLAFKFHLPFREWEEGPEPEEEEPAKKGKTLKILREKMNLLCVVLGKTDARTWSDDKICEFLSNIPNNVAEDVDISEESESLQKLLDKLREGYKEGVKIAVLPKKKKKAAAAADEE